MKLLTLSALSPALLVPPPVAALQLAAAPPNVRIVSPLAAPATVPIMGTQIHFPSKIHASQAEWDDAERATMEAGKVFPNGFLRYTGLGYERYWRPWSADGASIERELKILTLTKRAGMRPLRVDTYGPWPGSAWEPEWMPAWEWGQLKREWLPQLVANYKADVATYRRLLKVVGFKESDAIWQDGNEPASGHPGGNVTLPQGTWDPLNLERMRTSDAAAIFGSLKNVAAAYSMLDHPADVASREISTSGADGFAWAAKKDARAMHFLFYRPDAGTPERYAELYVAELSRRALLVQAQAWPRSTPTREGTRKAGVWVTEAYVATGHCPEPRAESWRLVLAKVRAGVPGVAGFVAYRFHPSGGPAGLDWQIPKGAISADSATTAKIK